MRAQLEQQAGELDSRVAYRRKLRLVAHGSTAAQPLAEVVIHDLSATGVLIETAATLSQGERLEVDIPEASPTAATVVWSSGQFFGCKFDRAVPKAVLSAATLRSAAPTPAAARQSSAVQVAEQAAADPDRWPLSSRLQLLVSASVAGWAFVGLVVWAAI